jgi:hypothetical protein
MPRRAWAGTFEPRSPCPLATRRLSDDLGAAPFASKGAQREMVTLWIKRPFASRLPTPDARRPSIAVRHFVVWPHRATPAKAAWRAA